MDQTLDGMDKEKILDAVYHALVETGEDVTAAEALLQSAWSGKFIVCGATEGFDCVLGVLLDDARGERFIWRPQPWTITANAKMKHASGEGTHEVRLRAGEYESVVEDFLNWLELETGFRPDQRDWIELSKEEREDIRKAVIERKPSLARPDKRSLLERSELEELARRKITRKPIAS